MISYIGDRGKMSTRCFIAKKMQNGKYKAVYSHWDGYPEKPGVGWTLKKYYTNPQKVSKLISKGDISSLYKNIGRKHEFNDYDTTKEKEWTTFYHRDRGEPWSDTKPKIFANIDDLIDMALGSMAEHLYVFKKGTWYHIDLSDTESYNKSLAGIKKIGWNNNVWGV